MSTYQPETYGESVADLYDDWYADYDASMIDMLAELTRDGRALELGIGTGRVALPLSQHGIEVHGIELSAHMAEQMRKGDL